MLQQCRPTVQIIYKEARSASENVDFTHHFHDPYGCIPSLAQGCAATPMVKQCAICSKRLKDALIMECKHHLTAGTSGSCGRKVRVCGEIVNDTDSFLEQYCNEFQKMRQMSQIKLKSQQQQMSRMVKSPLRDQS